MPAPSYPPAPEIHDPVGHALQLFVEGLQKIALHTVPPPGRPLHIAPSRLELQTRINAARNAKTKAARHV